MKSRRLMNAPSSVSNKVTVGGSARKALREPDAIALSKGDSVMSPLLTHLLPCSRRVVSLLSS